MHVISRKKLRDFATRHIGSGKALEIWYRTAKSAHWETLVDVQYAYAAADYVAPYTIFNVKGNTYRIIAKIEYRFQRIYIIAVLTHSEYDKDNWK